MTVRVRFAPSPTGSLHLGGARTALYNAMLAKKQGGTFILRIDDTDQERHSESCIQSQLNDLKWLGLDWQEGPDTTLIEQGAYGPYRQSQRLALYAEYAQQLLEQGHAYYCFMSEDDILAQKEAAQNQGRPFRLDSPDRALSLEEARKRLQQGERATVRFKIPEQHRDYHFDDLVRGRITLPTHMIGDFVLLRSDGMPVYNFCCAIDDGLMKITHVFRGEEHLSNTLRQLMVYEALNITPPTFGHLSVILGPSGKKLSKRDATVSCEDFQAQGYLPDALCNYIALLGWSPKDEQEIFSPSELTQAFDPNRLNAAAPTFDPQKLKWVNQQHIKRLSHAACWQAIAPFIDGLNLPKDTKWQQRAIAALQPNLETLLDAKTLFQKLTLDPIRLDDEAMTVMQAKESQDLLKIWLQLLQQQKEDFLSDDAFHAIIEALKGAGFKGKSLFMPLRIAMIGQCHGVELKQLSTLLPIQTLQERAQKLSP